jgi:hypothetical protein
MMIRSYGNQRSRVTSPILSDHLRSANDVCTDEASRFRVGELNIARVTEPSELSGTGYSSAPPKLMTRPRYAKSLI